MSRIEGLNPQQFKELRELMSYDISKSESYHSGGWRSRKRSLLGKKGDFPTGLLYIVEEYINVKNIVVYKNRSTRICPIRLLDAPGTRLIPGTYSEPYPEQREAVIAAMRFHRGIISASTGVGKSLIVGLLCDAFKVKTLVVVPSLELKRQLTASLKHWFGGLDNITVQNVDALDPNEELLDTGMVIIDEFHHAAAKTYRQLNKKAWKNVYYRFGVTATPLRSNENERLLLESILSQVIYRINYQHAITQGYIVPLEAYYYDLPKQDIQGNEYNWASMYSELIVNNEYRNLLISTILGRLHKEDKHTLCLVKEIKHGQILSELTGFPFANGQDEGSKELISDFNTGGLKTLIATSGVCGEGVDTKPAEYVILAGGGKAKVQFMQNVGRGFRTYGGKESAKVILFRERSHKWFNSHFLAQCRILREEYGIKPIRLTLDNE